MAQNLAAMPCATNLCRVAKWRDSCGDLAFNCEVSLWICGAFLCDDCAFYNPSFHNRPPQDKGHRRVWRNEVKGRRLDIAMQILTKTGSTCPGQSGRPPRSATVAGESKRAAGGCIAAAKRGAAESGRGGRTIAQLRNLSRAQGSTGTLLPQRSHSKAGPGPGAHGHELRPGCGVCDFARWSSCTKLSLSGSRGRKCVPSWS